MIHYFTVNKLQYAFTVVQFIRYGSILLIEYLYGDEIWITYFEIIFMQCILNPNIFAANLTNKPQSWMSCGVYGLNYHPMEEKLPNLWIYWDSFRLKRYKTKRKYVNLCKRLFRSSNPKIPLWQHTPIQISMAVYPNLSNSMDIIWKVIHVWSATIQR